MKTRPTSITVVSWILIVLGILSAVSTTVTVNNPMVLDVMSRSPLPIPVQYAISYIGSSIAIVSGVGMRKGANWARLLYVIWSIIGFVIGFTTSPMKVALIPGLVIFLVIAFFLFRPKTSAYFSSAEPPGDAQRT